MLLNHYRCKWVIEMPLKVRQDPRKVSRKPIRATWALRTTTQTISKFRTELGKKATNNSKDYQLSKTSQLRNRKMLPSPTQGSTRRQIAHAECCPKNTASIRINPLLANMEWSKLQLAPVTNSAKLPSYVEQIRHHL